MRSYRSYDYQEYDREREIDEAIQAGELALQSLRRASDKLDSARGWGILDLFGGGLISGVVKHSKVQDAATLMQEARYNLERFRKEIGDIRDLGNPNVQIGELLTLADFFLDGFVADILVQSRINDARRSVRDTIQKTEQALDMLRRARIE